MNIINNSCLKVSIFRTVFGFLITGIFLFSCGKTEEKKSLQKEPAAKEEVIRKDRAELTDEELINEYEALSQKIISDFKNTGYYDQKDIERFMELQLAGHFERELTYEQYQKLDSITEAYTAAVNQ